MEKPPDLKYIVIRGIQSICVAVFLFGFLWNGTEVMNLTASQFMMLYGGIGSLISEGIARLFKKK